MIRLPDLHKDHPDWLVLEHSLSATSRTYALAQSSPLFVSPAENVRPDAHMLRLGRSSLRRTF